MARLYLAAACVLLLILGSFADVEHEEHAHDHHHHHHHGDHDHESHKNLFAGDAAGTENEEREKLRGIAKKIDTNQDEQISRDEMRDYIGQRIRNQHTREADDLIATLDPKNTNSIVFGAFLQDSYGDMDLKELEKTDKSDPHSREARRAYLTDRKKWTHLDKDNDQVLSYEEFRKFLRPEDDDDLRKIEIDGIMKEYDDNKDGKISNDEYLKMTEAETGQADTLGEELDANKDGFGDYEEFSRYYLPRSSTTMDEETDHLLKECDADKNGYCSPDEIVKAYSSFAGSQITDFGADLEAPKEEL